MLCEHFSFGPTCAVFFRCIPEEDRTGRNRMLCEHFSFGPTCAVFFRCIPEEDRTGRNRMLCEHFSFGPTCAVFFRCIPEEDRTGRNRMLCEHFSFGPTCAVFFRCIPEEDRTGRNISALGISWNLTKLLTKFLSTPLPRSLVIKAFDFFTIKCLQQLYSTKITYTRVYIDGFQMSIKRPTSKGQTRDQEAAVQRTFHLERSSFFYISVLMVRTRCSAYFAHSCTKHRP